MDLEKIYREKRFFQVGIPESAGPNFLPEGLRELLGGFRLIRGRMTEEEAEVFLEEAQQYPGQQGAKTRNIFGST